MHNSGPNLRRSRSAMGLGFRSVSLVLLAGILSVPAQSVRQSNGSSQNAPEAVPSRWQLTWSDEFDGANGSLPDASKWTPETGGGGWGNRELQYYTARAGNAHQESGDLVITANSETYTGPDGVTRNFTSARLKTAGKFSQTYGRFEARIKLPTGRGLWPAFWLLGDDRAQAGWPACGEIDIVELVGSAPATILGTIHGPGYSGSAGISTKYTLASGKSFTDDFHIFAVEWAPNIIRFYTDDVLYATRNPTDLPAGSHWVFDKPFYIILNVAVGGNLPGPPDGTTVLPQTMLVDYVRVFKRMS